MIKTLLASANLWWIVGAVVLIFAGAFGAQHLLLVKERNRLTAERADRAEERATAAETAASAAGANLKESERRVSALEGVLRATQPALDTARAAADLVPDLDRRVRAATAALGACRRGAAADPAATAGGSPAEEAAGVLAELQRGSQEAERARARYADEAAGAGERCERIHDTLTVSPGPAVVGSE